MICKIDSDLLGLFEALPRSAPSTLGGDALCLVKLGALFGPMQLFFEDGLRLNGLELGLEIMSVVNGAVGATAVLVHVEGAIEDFIAGFAPGCSQSMLVKVILWLKSR